MSVLPHSLTREQALAVQEQLQSWTFACDAFKASAIADDERRFLETGNEEKVAEWEQELWLGVKESTLAFMPGLRIDPALFLNVLSKTCDMLATRAGPFQSMALLVCVAVAMDQQFPEPKGFNFNGWLAKADAVEEGKRLREENKTIRTTIRQPLNQLFGKVLGQCCRVDEARTKECVDLAKKHMKPTLLRNTMEVFSFNNCCAFKKK